jgi:hypothetical protein
MALLALCGGVPARLASAAAERNLSSLASCPRGSICNHALGIAITPAPGVQLLPPGKEPSGVLALMIPPAPGHGLDYDVRLVIQPLETTRDRNDARAAAAGVETIVRAYPTHLTLSRETVRYGGAPGILVRGLPGAPGPAIVIVLAHAGAVYRITAPGARLALDQRRMLTSLRFIPRVGGFPLANPPATVGPRTRRTIPLLLRVIPDPVALRQPWTISLLGVHAGYWFSFILASRSVRTVSRRLMGRHRANAAGVVSFRYPPFTSFSDLGQWIVTARSHTGRQVASTTLTVADLLLQPHSPRVVPGRAYPFRLYTHCGVHFSVDFDHSFWDLTDRRWADRPDGTGPHAGLGNPFQPGTMTLIDAGHARFDFVSHGPNTGVPGRTEQMRFTRHTGAKIVPGYCS